MADHRYSNTSEKRLYTCDPRIVRVFTAVLPQFDHAILCGCRGREEQNRAFREGLSHTDWPNSRHNVRPLGEDRELTAREWELPMLSRAVDAFPKPEGGWAPEAWDWDDTSRFHHFAGIVLATGHAMGVPLRWGGNWDGDHRFRDQTLMDLVHFELRE